MKKKRIGYEQHGMTKTPEYMAWRNMINRCTSKNDPGYHRYGGRGIRVCDEWAKSFLAFYRHIGKRPGKGYSVDRINTDSDYSPGNVRWATRKQQQQNIRTNVNITYMGETHCIREWARRLNLNHRKISARYAAGEPIEKVFSCG